MAYFTSFIIPSPLGTFWVLLTLIFSSYTVWWTLSLMNKGSEKCFHRVRFWPHKKVYRIALQLELSYLFLTEHDANWEKLETAKTLFLWRRERAFSIHFKREIHFYIVRKSFFPCEIECLWEQIQNASCTAMFGIHLKLHVLSVISNTFSVSLVTILYQKDAFRAPTKIFHHYRCHALSLLLHILADSIAVALPLFLFCFVIISSCFVASRFDGEMGKYRKTIMKYNFRSEGLLNGDGLSWGKLKYYIMDH